MQLANWNTFLRHRELLWAWTVRNVSARYKQSLLGIVWTILQPAARVAVYTIVFTRIVRIDTGSIPYPVFNFTAMAPWILFSTGLTDMVSSLAINMNLVTKVYFPREILPIAAMLARLIDFAIALGVLMVLIITYGMPIHVLGWLFVPVIVVVQMMLSLGLGMMGAALNVFYRDVQHIFTLVIQIWLYASPVIYPVSRVPEEYRTLYFLNPMAGILEAYRSTILFGQLPDATLGTAAVVSLVVLGIGYWFFKRVEFQFADVV